MTVLTRFQPFREFSTLQDRINRVFRESYRGDDRDESLSTSSFVPAVDVYEDEHQVTLKIEVPGIDEKDIDVQVENNTLTVHGERKIEKEEKEENYRRVESQYGSFTRTFTLPTTVDTENVAATYDKGVLKITLPKKAEAKPKQIKVNVGGAKRPSKPKLAKRSGGARAPRKLSRHKMGGGEPAGLPFSVSSFCHPEEAKTRAFSRQADCIGSSLRSNAKQNCSDRTRRTAQI